MTADVETGPGDGRRCGLRVGRLVRRLRPLRRGWRPPLHVRPRRRRTRAGRTVGPLRRPTRARRVLRGRCSRRAWPHGAPGRAGHGGRDRRRRSLAPGHATRRRGPAPRVRHGVPRVLPLRAAARPSRAPCTRCASTPRARCSPTRSTRCAPPCTPTDFSAQRPRPTASTACGEVLTRVTGRHRARSSVASSRPPAGPNGAHAAQLLVAEGAQRRLHQGTVGLEQARRSPPGPTASRPLRVRRVGTVDVPRRLSHAIAAAPCPGAIAHRRHGSRRCGGARRRRSTPPRGRSPPSRRRGTTGRTRARPRSAAAKSSASAAARCTPHGEPPPPD